jgi:hypothetical protein
MRSVKDIIWKLIWSINKIYINNISEHYYFQINSSLFHHIWNLNILQTITNLGADISPSNYYNNINTSSIILYMIFNKIFSKYNKSINTNLHIPIKLHFFNKFRYGAISYIQISLNSMITSYKNKSILLNKNNIFISSFNK